MNNAFQARVTVRISFLVILVLLPFLLYHAHAMNWQLVALLSAILVAETLLIHFVNRGGSPWVAAHVVSLAYTAGVLYVVHVMGAIGSYWLYPVILANFYMLPLASAVSLNLVVIVGGVLLMRDMPEIAARIGTTLGVITVFSYIFARQLAGQREELNELALVDPLTRAFNRRALDERLVQLGKEKARHDIRVAAIMLDIDHFKRINDRFDHHTGDDVLAHVVDVMMQRLRAGDSLFRYGGEEFVVIAMHTSLEEAERLAEDLRSKVMAVPAPSVGQVTLSAGVAELQPGEEPMAWISRADDALYQAKNMGRNRVCVGGAMPAVTA